MIRRINLFGGPSIGKTTTSLYVAHFLKERGTQIELVKEYVKQWVYLDREPQGFDQVYLFSKQLMAETIPLNAGCSLVVTDSPLVLSAYYGYKNNLSFTDSLLKITNDIEEQYPSINIMLKRDENEEYVQFGRWQTEKESMEIDDQMQLFLDSQHIKYVEVKKNDKESLNKILLSI